MLVLMSDIKRKISSVVDLMRAQGPEKEVSKFWLFRTAGRMNRRFEASASLNFHRHGEFLKIENEGQIFLWPGNASLSVAVQQLSEILTPRHPHQYFYGHTKLDQSDVVLDIGACEGSFSALVTSRCRRVVAVEPSRRMCALIREVFRVRREPCPEVLNCLMGREQGRAYFYEDICNPGASRIVTEPIPGSYELPVRTLDDISQSLDLKPTFIKCDAEGAEEAIFSGGQRFLLRSHPKLAITTYHNDGDYAAMHLLLTSLGYQVKGKGLLFSPQTGKLRVQMIHAW